MVLYERCPEFLKEGMFGCVGAMEGMLTDLVAALKNTWWPRVLGETPRRYFCQRTTPTQEGREELVRLVQEGKLRVVIDSVFDMEDALGVSPSSSTCFTGALSLILGNRRMNGT